MLQLMLFKVAQFISQYMPERYRHVFPRLGLNSSDSRRRRVRSLGEKDLGLQQERESGQISHHLQSNDRRSRLEAGSTILEVPDPD